MSNAPAPIKKPVVSDLWKSEGTIDRVPYATLGVSLLSIKYCIDVSIAELIFHRHWEIWNYIFPGQALDFIRLTGSDRLFYLTLIVLALPFIWIGVVLTMRRLRSSGLPVFLVKLFFVPVINLVMFVLLCVLPKEKEESIFTADGGSNPLITSADSRTLAPKLRGDSDAPQSPQSPQSPQLPQSPEPPQLPQWPKPNRPKPLVVTTTTSNREEALRTLVQTVPAGLFLIWLGSVLLQSYGWGLFLGVPFGVGMGSAFLYGKDNPKTMAQCQGIAALATLSLGFGIMFWAWEGVICLLMASPIAFALAAMGAYLGYYVQKRSYSIAEQKLISIALLLSLPSLMGAEYASHPVAPMISVVSEVDIAAPPSVVWNNVIAFPRLKPPTDPIFALGISYPVGATITGRGPGAVRRCRFSTGAFVEPIEVWDEPNLLKFGVRTQPPTMREWSWMHEIHPAHLEGYLLVHSGQFKLTPIAISGRAGTHLEGTTSYQNRMWPGTYWSLWSNNIIHRIHMRVLNHIKETTEAS